MVQTWAWTRGSDRLSDLQEAFSDLVEDLFGAVPAAGRFPAAELRGTDEGYQLIVALPGVRREDIELSVEEQVVHLEGERRPAEVPAGAEVIRRERRAGRFRRTVRLPEAVDTTRARARLEHGLLTIDLPLPEEKQPREITIEVEEEG